MREIKIYFGANQSQPVNVRGNYIRIQSAPGGAVVVSDVESGLESLMLSGQAVAVAREFKQLFIVNGPVAQVVTLIVGSGEFKDSRLQGVVDVAGVVETSPDFSRSINGTAFSVMQYIVATVGNGSAVHFKNPVGSGVVVCVTGIVASLYIADSISVGRYSGGGVVGGENKGQSKSGSANSVAGMLAAQIVGGVVSSLVGYSQLSLNFLGSKVPLTVNYQHPVVLFPGAGLALGSGAVADGVSNSLTCNFDYFEVPV